MDVDLNKEENKFFRKEALRDNFVKIIQDLRLEARDIEDFHELKRLKEKIKEYEFKLAYFFPDFNFGSI